MFNCIVVNNELTYDEMLTFLIEIYYLHLISLDNIFQLNVFSTI